MSEPPKLTAYLVTENPGYVLEPSPRRRRWMDEFHAKAPYRCLPLVMANQAGWIVRCPCEVRATWTGGPRIDDLTVEVDDPACERFVASHFGGGILTFILPWLFRTPEGLGLWVRGPSNDQRPDASGLDGLVESDWNRVPFTMNTQIWEVGEAVVFEKGEPICLLMPFPMDLLESVEPVERRIEDDADLHRDYLEATARRSESVARNRERGEDTFERDYLKGIRADGSRHEPHRTGLKLRPFARPG